MFFRDAKGRRESATSPSNSERNTSSRRAARAPDSMDAKSSKFWNIELAGSSYSVTYGRIGTDGQSTTKEWKSEEEASKQYEKLVAEKVGKGYKLVGDE